MRMSLSTCWQKLKTLIDSIFSIDKKAGYLLRKLISNFVSDGSKYGISDLAEFLELPVVALKIWVVPLCTG